MNETYSAVAAGNPENLPDVSVFSGDAAYRRLVEDIGDYAILMLTPDGRVASWNEGARRIKRYSAEEIIGQHFSKFYPEEARASGHPEFELTQAASVGRFEDEGWRVRKDGTQFWANVVISALHDSGGRLIGFSKITRDLTERKAQEETLRQSEEHLRLLIESVEDYAIFRLDTDGIVATWNRGAERIKGYGADEIIGQHFSRFYQEAAVRAGWPDYELRVAAQTGRFEDEGLRVRKDGSVFWANVIITAMRDDTGRLRGYSKITRDLTERRRHETSLKESEASLRLLVNGVTDHALLMLSPDGRFVGWNDGAERLFGFSRDEGAGRGAEILYLPEDVASDRPRRDLHEAAKRDSIQLSGWRLRRDGTQFWADVTLTAVRHDNGELHAYVQITKDVTQGRRITELETKGKRIEEFLAMLAHELRNPLAPISNSAALLRATATDRCHLRCADVIGRQVTHLSRLVDDLLDVSRMTSGKIRIRREDIDLKAVIAAAVDSIHPMPQSYGQVLEVSLPSTPVMMSGDAMRITQVVVNLLTNSAKYTPRGGRIDLLLRTEGNAGVLEVVDNGIGMSAELLVTAFDIFVQGDRALDRPEGGLGVGLPLVKRIVELHGGSIHATSGGAGQGCKMTVTVPLQPVRPTGKGQASSEKIETRFLTLLVVDDNLDARESLTKLLSTMGHRVRSAADGVEALRLAGEDRPDAILLDIGLPGLDGFEVARQLRAMPDLGMTVLIAVTGYAGESDKLRAKDSGFDWHLTKPVDVDTLLRVLSCARLR